jgi:hypothetical protein
MALGDSEAWACVRLRGAAPAEWLLLEPLPLVPAEAASPSLLTGLAARFGRGKAAAPRDGEPAAADWHPWLRRLVRGHLRWLARYPLGAGGAVERCRLEGAEWPPPAADREDALSRFRQALGYGKLEAVAYGKLADDQPVIGSGGGLRLRALDGREADEYVWADDAARAAFRAAAPERVWAVAWCDAGLIAPLAVVVPGGLFSQPRLVHLVPGCLAEPL